jgi:O-antigen/teichoic acid export membrane protein
MGESLKAKTFANVGYNSIARVITLVFQTVGTIILTRTLTAGDYGIVGFAAKFKHFIASLNG